ncbi:uncharacterized protein M421DRAFT_417881 [Didymella exigua CBS 183.55]|uniref:Uncharacterized protein n=1 Tax=Didymella exigua CBS 183.55 TaxID=1150837 RepID=A0A6A5RUJ0_9PLEO|nr:uncharacterized protein M421DRAFT_417881 [Didymella exigua CBS 183.55]KAF1931229.1 hypothetical protein M421DRAFT_417881 [Didymella exigua CBS 183.55]
MTTRRTRRAAAAAEVTEEVITIETRSKRTRAAPRKAATTTATTSTKTKSTTRAKRASTPTGETTPNARANAQPTTRQKTVATTPAPATNSKRRLRSTNTEAASPLRALDEQPAKRQRTTSRKAPSRSAPAKSVSSQDDDDDEETPMFFTKKFDSFDVQEPEPEPSAEFMTGDESAMALLRLVQEAARSPRPVESVSEVQLSPSAPKSLSPPPATIHQSTSTPSRSIFASFTTPFTALKNLFGTPAAASPSPSPTPSRLPPAGSMTEALSIPPTPVGERAKRTSKKANRRPNRFVKTLLQGVEQHEIDQAAAWAERIAADLQKDSAAGDKRKRLETPVLFRDLEHFPASKPWQSGFRLPEDVLDLDDDDVVPAWAVYISMVEEEHRQTKRSKTAHVTPIDDEMPASLNELFGSSTTSEMDFHPRRAIEPSPMFDTPLNHKEGGNIFTELHGHDAVASDRETLQRELKARGSQAQNQVKTCQAKTAQSLTKAHDPAHGSFSVPDSDSEDEDDEVASVPPVWTQAPPPAPTPAHVSLPNTSQQEVERQRQKLMKHTPHKPSRLQQVSYPSPSVMSDAGASPMKLFDDEIPSIEPLVFGDAELDAAIAALSKSEGLEAKLSAMHWSMPVMSYDSDEEEVSPI